MWIVEATHATNDGWQNRDATMESIAGRRWDSSWASGGARALMWYCDSFDAARGLRDALKTVPGVLVVARDPINGR